MHPCPTMIEHITSGVTLTNGGRAKTKEMLNEMMLAFERMLISFYGAPQSVFVGYGERLMFFRHATHE